MRHSTKTGRGHARGGKGTYVRATASLIKKGRAANNSWKTMTKAANKNTATERLKDRLEEQDKAMEELKRQMEEKEKEFEERVTNEINTRRCAEQETIPVEGISVGGEVCNVSEVSSKSRSTVIEQLKLIPGRKINCHIYIYTVLFPEIKFIDDDIFKESPKILEEAMNRMGIEGEVEKLQHIEDTKREIKHCLAHRRSYCKDQQAKKYKGTMMKGKLDDKILN